MFNEALEESEKALDLAKKAGLTRLEASVMHDLAVINWRLGSVEKAKDLSEQLLAISRSLSNTRGESMAYGVLGNIELSKSHYQEAKEHYQKMLQTEIQTGDIRGQGMAQGNLGIIAEIEEDHASAIQIFRNVREIFLEMGDLASAARAWAHIGLDYSLQGLLEEAKPNLEKAMAIFREIDGKQGLQWVLGLLSRVCFDTGELAQSEKYCLEALDIAQNAGVKYYKKFSWWMLGRIHMAQGEIDQAEIDLLKAKNDVEEGRQNNSVLASFAEIELTRGNITNALRFVDEILVEGSELSFEIDNKDRLEILLTCYIVLIANGDDRAIEVLEAAHILLNKQLEKISDESIRQAFLQNVPANREILHFISPG